MNHVLNCIVLFYWLLSKKFRLFLLLCRTHSFSFIFLFKDRSLFVKLFPAGKSLTFWQSLNLNGWKAWCIILKSVQIVLKSKIEIRFLFKDFRCKIFKCWKVPTVRLVKNKMNHLMQFYANFHDSHPWHLNSQHPLSGPRAGLKFPMSFEWKWKISKF